MNRETETNTPETLAMWAAIEKLIEEFEGEILNVGFSTAAWAVMEKVWEDGRAYGAGQGRPPPYTGRAKLRLVKG